MDQVLSGILWRILRDPGAGDWIAMTQDGHPYYAWKHEPQASAPDSLVVYYWDDGISLHGDHVERGDDASSAKAAS